MSSLIYTVGPRPNTTPHHCEYILNIPTLGQPPEDRGLYKMPLMLMHTLGTRKEAARHEGHL